MSACECSLSDLHTCGNELEPDFCVVEFVPHPLRTPEFKIPTGAARDGVLVFRVNFACAAQITSKEPEWTRVLPRWVARRMGSR